MSVYERHALSNGLRVLTAPLGHAQSVACYIFLNTGSRYEDASNRGIAHFAEHMFFKGTERRPTAKDISLAVEGMGGEFNAFTSKEYTAYYIRCAGEQRDTALDVLVDMVRHSLFDPEEIEREKGVIVEEMNMYIDTPRDYVGSVYEELLFGSNPLGWETLGTKATVTGATRKTFTDYLDHWYTPERMVVGVAGMVGDDLLPAARGAARRSRRERRRRAGCRPTCPTGDGPRVRIHHKDSDQAQVCLGVPSYPLEHPDRYALQLLATVLGGGMSSRLFLEVRERRGLAYYIFGSNSSFTDAGTLYSQGGVDLARVDEAVKVIAEQFRLVANERVPDDELEKARALAKGRFVLQTESPNGLLLFGLRREVLEGAAIEPEELLRRARRGHRRRHPARRAGRDRLARPQPGAGRAVRRRRALRQVARVVAAKKPTKTRATAQKASSFTYQCPRIAARSRTPAETPTNQVGTKRPPKQRRRREPAGEQRQRVVRVAAERHVPVVRELPDRRRRRSTTRSSPAHAQADPRVAADGRRRADAARQERGERPRRRQARVHAA